MLKVMTHRESQYLFQTIEYFYMERVTFVKTSLLPSINDEFCENAHFLKKKKLSLYIKKTQFCIFIKKTQTSNMSFYKKLHFWK